MNRELSIDLETFSSVDITKAGLYKYVRAPDFQIMLFGYAYNEGPIKIIDPANGEQIPMTVIDDLFNPQIIKKAWNAAFEWYCLCKHFNIDDRRKHGWLHQWHDTALQSLYCGYPGSLAGAGPAIGLPEDKQKLTTGRALIKTFCVPCKPTPKNGYRIRTLPHHEPEKWDLFKTYNGQDVEAERTAGHILDAFPVPENEWALWRMDIAINERGVRVDPQLIDAAMTASDQTNDRLLKEAAGIIDNPKSVKQMLEWLKVAMGDDAEDVTNLRKETVKNLLNEVDGDSTTHRILEIRQELSKTSIKKYHAMAAAMCSDGRVRGVTQFYGANRTGRWAGRIVQLQNLPKNYIETLEMARNFTKAGRTDMLQLIYGNVPDTLSQLIRTAFIPSEGNELVIADFSAIEARVIAWLAGETWRLEVFKTHGKIYEASASAMFGVPIELISKGNPEYALRAKGKIAELALGYQGASGALIAMGALKMGLAEADLPEIVQRWRAANKRIVDLWYTMERAAIDTLETGRPNTVKYVTFAHEYDPDAGLDFLTIQLPSGRKLYYSAPKLITGDRNRQNIHYAGVNQLNKKWGDLETYGGKLTENITQAIARDCLAVAMQRLTAAGHKIVFHVHDEAIIDAPKGQDTLAQLIDIMGQPIPWAPGLLLKADGFATPFYKKD